MCELHPFKCPTCNRRWTARRKLASCVDPDDPDSACPEHLCMIVGGSGSGGGTGSSGTRRRLRRAECDDCKVERERREEEDEEAADEDGRGKEKQAVIKAGDREGNMSGQGVAFRGKTGNERAGSVVNRQG